MARYPCQLMPLTVTPKAPNHGRNTEMKTSRLATAMTRSAVFSLLMSKRNCGADPAGGCTWPPGLGAAGRWSLRAWPQLGQKSASALTCVPQFGHISIDLLNLLLNPLGMRLQFGV